MARQSGGCWGGCGCGIAEVVWVCDCGIAEDLVVGLRRWFGSVIGWRVFRTSLTAVTLTFTASLKCGEVVCSIQVRGTRE